MIWKRSFDKEMLRMNALLKLHRHHGLADIGTIANSLADIGFTVFASSDTVKDVSKIGDVHILDVTTPGAVNIWDGIASSVYDALAVAPIKRQPHALWFHLLCVDLYPSPASLETNGRTNAPPGNIALDKTAIALISAAIYGERFILCDRNDYLPFVNWKLTDPLKRDPFDEQLCLNMRLKALDVVRRCYPSLEQDLLRMHPNLDGLLPEITSQHLVSLFPHLPVKRPSPHPPSAD